MGTPAGVPRSTRTRTRQGYIPVSAGTGVRGGHDGYIPVMGIPMGMRAPTTPAPSTASTRSQHLPVLSTHAQRTSANADVARTYANHTNRHQNEDRMTTKRGASMRATRRREPREKSETTDRDKIMHKWPQHHQHQHRVSRSKDEYTHKLRTGHGRGTTSISKWVKRQDHAHPESGTQPQHHQRQMEGHRSEVWRKERTQGRSTAEHG
ncbi:hypothetical protein F4604DRAFT_1679342 [Suillus subluteus]|nr:hypothetical protein F4604DRAFT_1679342 [Suillus subluteus]